MANQEAVDIARRMKDPLKAAKQLITEALKRESKDDISCVVVKFRWWYLLHHVVILDVHFTAIIRVYLPIDYAKYEKERKNDVSSCENAFLNRFYCLRMFDFFQSSVATKNVLYIVVLFFIRDKRLCKRRICFLLLFWV